MEPAKRILIDTADPALAERLGRALEKGGFSLKPLASHASGEDPDVAMGLLELGTDPRADERRIRYFRQVFHRPVIALAHRGDSRGPTAALDAGACDFVFVESAEAELVARVNAQLELRTSRDRLARQERALALLLELTQTLVSTLDFQEILYTMVSRIAEVVQVDRVSIVLVPDAHDVGYVVAASDDQAVFNLKLDLQKYPEILHVLETRQALAIADVETHPVLDGVRSSVTGAGLSALTLIPIVWEEHAMGVLFIRGTDRKGALSERQLGLCRVLANATAIALRNARILQTLRDETRRDTYARIEAEKRLQSLKRYADLFASSADGIAVFDSDWRLLFANPGAFRILDQDEGERLGKRIWRMVPHDERRNVIGFARRMQKGDFPRNVDIRFKRKDDSSVVISGSFSPLSGTEGAVLLSFRDVTDERKTQDELVHTRNFLQSLIDASVDAIVAADMKGKIILFNQGAQRLYGYSLEHALGGLRAQDLYPANGAREVGRMLRAESHGGVGRLQPVRMEALDSEGNIFPISLTAAWILEDGKPVATFGIFTDLRERVRVEEQLAQAQEKLAVSEKQALVAELAGATAHELNQPLTSMMGYSELLTRLLEPDSRAHKAAGVIHGEAQRMAEIVRKIGKLTRYETKSYVGEQKILDIDRAAADGPEEGAA
jgi:PAS domain S-box-containing protein